MVTFTINIPPMLAYIPYMDPMGYVIVFKQRVNAKTFWDVKEYWRQDNRYMPENPWWM